MPPLLGHPTAACFHSSSYCSAGHLCFFCCCPRAPCLQPVAQTACLESHRLKGPVQLSESWEILLCFWSPTFSGGDHPPGSSQTVNSLGSFPLSSIPATTLPWHGSASLQSQYLGGVGRKIRGSGPSRNAY